MVYLHLILSNLYPMWHESYCMVADPINHLFRLSDTRFFRPAPDGTKSSVPVFGKGLLDLLDDVFWMLPFSSSRSFRQLSGRLNVFRQKTALLRTCGTLAFMLSRLNIASRMQGLILNCYGSKDSSERAVGQQRQALPFPLRK